MSETSDAQLMVRLKSGDREAFRPLLDRHKDALVNYLTRLTGCRDRGEDLAQEAFLRLYRHRERYREEGHLAGYLYRIALNLLRQEERQQRRRKLLGGLLGPQDSMTGGRGGPVPSPARDLLLRRESHMQLSRALTRLPFKVRVPLVLHEIQGWPYRSIATALGCREGTIKSRISRGRKQLRQTLTPYMADPPEQMMSQETLI